MVSFFRILDSDRHVLFCPMVFVADTYKGCPHACWYCYAPATRRRGYKESFEQFRYFKLRLTGGDIEKIGLACAGNDRAIGALSKRGQEKNVAKALERRFPLRIGSVSEPFGLPLEKEYGHTYKVLEILSEYDYPYVVCTKSPYVATQKYVNLLKSTNLRAVQISLISTDEQLLRYIESRPGGRTPPANARLEAIKKLTDNDIWTTCRIQPMIPRLTEMGMKDLIFSLAEAGANHVIVEFLRMPLSHAKPMGARLKKALDDYCEAGGTVGDDLRKCNNNIYTFYKSFRDHTFAGGHLFFSTREKARLMPLFAKMVEEANKELGTKMTFGSGDEETQFLNSTENCCGMDQLEGYSGYSTCTVQTMLRIAKEKGKVTLEDMRQFYNPDIGKFQEVWKKKDRNNRYFIAKRVFKLRARPIDDPSEVEYVFDEGAFPI